MIMEVSENGIKLIEGFEGFSGVAYKDVAGVWTIGFGHTGSDVQSLSPIAEDDAEQLLISDLYRFVQSINALVMVPINQNQMDALTSFTYNIGVSAFSTSLTLQRLNQGNYTSAAADMNYWVLAGGAVQPGLVARRKEESTLFMTAVEDVYVPTVVVFDLTHGMKCTGWNGDRRLLRTA